MSMRIRPSPAAPASSRARSISAKTSARFYGPPASNRTLRPSIRLSIERVISPPGRRRGPAAGRGRSDRPRAA
jgi:hypothetical protein